MSLEALDNQVKQDLAYLNIPERTWLPSAKHNGKHIYDVIIIGSGQSGLGAAFGLIREKITNILVIDENPEGFEGPWDTYARMTTLRTPKHLTSIDTGIPSLTFRSWWEAQYGETGWNALDKIPKGEWMNYLRWYRKILNLPVQNNTQLQLIEPLQQDKLHQLHLTTNEETDTVIARKVILATGIQGGGQWFVPSFIKNHLSKHVFAHTSESIDFSTLKDKKVAILGGGASAFDNANHALKKGVKEAHVFVRRSEMPRINPIRQMEGSGMIDRFHTFTDAQKYQVMAHFFTHNQPPTNDTFKKASVWPGFSLHTGEPWLAVEEDGDGVTVSTGKRDYTFDFLIISTGLRSDPALRPELRLIEPYIFRWRDYYQAPQHLCNEQLDAHPYLSPGFAFQSKALKGQKQLHGLFSFNYAALISCGLSASAISGLRYAIPKLAAAVADQLFEDHHQQSLDAFFSYDEEEFVADRESATESQKAMT
ncbi:NAD(P)-binding domain-containing protein [Gracilibacillus salinarum]|uniref:NAD(P)/FAD-dependent oxidoreductase n=1 Tax=Gracilibacillus salinarum TaxID=2932255 RepID=A0ABY4GGP2_9BACI|nr:NAD(P)/FAD-dependent oxidoreductase [Gracilibacillus salinarum]UOQ83364.1 NAD(P)/FAD-dependent oxidoreductase [Gracilibacillus salinarum]